MGNTRVVIGLIMVAVLMIVFPIVMIATHNLQTDEQTDANLAVTGSPPAGTVTLTIELWKVRTRSVLSIAGNGSEAAGAITAVSYAEATRVLTVTGVTDSTTLNVKYEFDALMDFTGMGPLVGVSPLLIWIAVLAIVLSGIYFTVRGKG